MDIAQTAGLVSAVQQGQTQQQVGLALLRGDLHNQQDAVATLLGNAGGGGYVTSTRGQNLNIQA